MNPLQNKCLFPIGFLKVHTCPTAPLCCASMMHQPSWDSMASVTSELTIMACVDGWRMKTTGLDTCCDLRNWSGSWRRAAISALADHKTLSRCRMITAAQYSRSVRPPPQESVLAAAQQLQCWARRSSLPSSPPACMLRFFRQSPCEACSRFRERPRADCEQRHIKCLFATVHFPANLQGSPKQHS